MQSDPGQPHPHWASLRATCPVSPDPQNAPGRAPVYDVTSWAAVNAILRDPVTFSNASYLEGTIKFMGPVLIAMDGEQHRSRRQLISHAFRTTQLARWKETLITPIIDTLCDAVAANGKAELMEEVISRFPVLVICGICGVPPEDGPRFLQWAKDIHRGMMDAATARKAAAEMRAYLEPLVEARREQPTDDLISDIVNARIDGEGLDDEEIYGFLRLLLPAGSESTFRSTASALLAILTTPGLYDRVLADRSLLPAIAEETVRWDVANTMVTRLATRDTAVEGCPIPAGARLRVITNAANRDEARFPDAATFDPDRPTQRHIGFGIGPHQCIGQPLARIEMCVGLDTMLTRLPNLRLDPAFPTPVVQGAAFRSPGELRVLFG